MASSIRVGTRVSGDQYDDTRVDVSTRRTPSLQTYGFFNALNRASNSSKSGVTGAAAGAAAGLDPLLALLL